MGVGTQVIIIMFDDNQITVAAQRYRINNAAICGRDNCLSFAARDINPLVAPSEAPKVSWITLPSVGQRRGDRRTG